MFSAGSKGNIGKKMVKLFIFNNFKGVSRTPATPCKIIAPKDIISDESF